MGTLKFSTFRVLALALMLATVPATGLAQRGVTLRTLNGAPVALNGLNGQVAVLAFGGLLDPQSPDELPVLQRVADRYASRGVVVYWVSLDPDRPGASGAVSNAELGGYAARHGFRGPILRDPSGATLRSISTGRRPQLPTFVVLDASGNVLGQPVTGFDRESDLVNQLAYILDRAVAR